MAMNEEPSSFSKPDSKTSGQSREAEVLGNYILRSSLVIAAAIVIFAFASQITAIIQSFGWYLPFLVVCLVVYTIAQRQA